MYQYVTAAVELPEVNQFRGAEDGDEQAQGEAAANPKDFQVFWS